MFSQYSQSIIPKSYNCKTLEGNWYQDRCVSNFNKENKANYSLPNSNAWQYSTTYNQIGSYTKNHPSLKEKFALSKDEYINYQPKSNNMYVSVYKHSYDPYYKETFKENHSKPGYYDNKEDKLKTYRSEWTKRDQSFDTTYKKDILNTFMMKKMKD